MTALRSKGMLGAVRNLVTIVDDSDELRFLVALLLKSELSMPCLALESFAEVRARADEVMDSHVIILDINLGPGQPDGLDVYRWLKERGYQGQVFFLTGHAQENAHVQAAAATGVRVLEKPMSPKELVQMLGEAVAPPKSKA